MVRRQLDDREWAKLEPLLLSKRERGGRPPKDNRNFIEAELWWRRTGVPWRDLPDAFGPWKTVFNRFDRWSRPASGTSSSKRSKAIATTNGTAWTARSTGR